MLGDDEAVDEVPAGFRKGFGKFEPKDFGVGPSVERSGHHSGFRFQYKRLFQGQDKHGRQAIPLGRLNRFRDLAAHSPGAQIANEDIDHRSVFQPKLGFEGMKIFQIQAEGVPTVGGTFFPRRGSGGPGKNFGEPTSLRLSSPGTA